MKIIHLKTVGFRKFQHEFETDLYDITDIIGGNTKGKTNILYAIIWAFLGTNLTGDDKVWLGHKNSDDCYVEVDFIDNQNNKHTIARYKNKYNNKKNFILLDNKKVDQEKIQSFYSDKKLFLSIINPNYFINKKPSEQKELISKYLPSIDVKDIYNKLDTVEKQYLEGIPENIIQYLQDLNDNKKMYENKIKHLIGRIEYAESFANTEIENKKEFLKEEELSLARQELSFLMNDNNSMDKNKQQKIVDNLQNQILQMKKQIECLTIKMKKGKAVYLSIKNEPNSYCPMCEQKIENDSRKTTINNMKTELEGYFADKTKMEDELLELQSKSMIERCKLHAVESCSNIDKDKQINTIKEQIKSLEQEQLEIEKYNNSIVIKQKNAEGAKSDIKVFNEQIKELEKLIDNVKTTKKVAEKLYINYIEEKMKFATKHLKNVKIKYYSVLKESGEIKEDFIITYNDNELKNLSRSEFIATSIELANMFNKISGVNIPLFIDDSESCADYNFIQDYAEDTQVLSAKVEKGGQLEIINHNVQNIKDFKATTKITDERVELIAA